MENLTDEKQIRDVIQNYSAAYISMNVGAVMSHLSDNPKRVMHYNNETAEGREAVKETYIRQFKMGKKADMSHDITSIVISHDTALVKYSWRLNYTNLEDNEIRLTGRDTVKLIKVGNVWKLNEIEETIDT